MKYRTSSHCPDLKKVNQEEFIASIRKLSKEKGKPFNGDFISQLNELADMKETFQGKVTMKSFSFTVPEALESSLEIESDEELTVYCTASKKENRFPYDMIHVIVTNKEEECYFLVDKIAHDIKIFEEITPTNN